MKSTTFGITFYANKKFKITKYIVHILVFIALTLLTER